MMRRHFAKYFPGLPDFKTLRIRLLQSEHNAEINDILDEMAETYRHVTVEY